MKSFLSLFYLGSKKHQEITYFPRDRRYACQISRRTYYGLIIYKLKKWKEKQKVYFKWHPCYPKEKNLECKCKWKKKDDEFEKPKGSQFKVKGD